MNNKCILICLEKVGIGGVETYAINQAIALKEKGYDVIVAAGDGVYKKTLEDRGIKFIDFEFKIDNYYDFDKIKKMIEIIKQNKVSEVHIHSFVNLSVMFMASVICNVPYVLYVHTGVAVIEETFEWFEGQSVILKNNFKDFFKLAYKIIVMNEKTREYLKDKYDVKDDKKVLYIRNSINFDEYKCKKEINNIKNVLIISRMDDVKFSSIKNGLSFFKELNKTFDNKLSLRVAGDGPRKDELEEFAKENDIKNVTFLGAITNVIEEMENSEIVIGVARCIIEAIAMKRIAIVSAYSGFRSFVDSGNINTEFEENFAGKALKEVKYDELANKIKKLDKTSELNKIVNENYKRIHEKLDINKNIYTCDLEKYDYNIGNTLYEMVSNTTQIIGEKLTKTIDKMDNDWKEHLKYKEWMESREKNFEEQIQEQQKIIEELRKKEKRLDALEGSRIIKKLEKIYEKRGIFDVNE